VPTYVVGEELYFGREHLRRIAWQLEGNNGPAPDIENSLPSNPKLNNLKARNPKSNKNSSPQITVGIDNSIDSLLAIPVLSELFDNKRLNAQWVHISSTNMADLMPSSATDSRSDLHRKYRQATQSLNQQRYAQHAIDGDLAELIEQQLEANKLDPMKDAQQVRERSPFPGVRVTIDDEVFIGRQHLPLIDAILS